MQLKTTETTDYKMMETKMKIEIWSDIMCPFCYIGKRNFETALSQFAHNHKIDVEWKSFQLDPTMPELPEHRNDVYSYVAEMKGMPYEHSVKAHNDVNQYAKRVGLDYKLDKVIVTNTLKGHRLIQLAKTKGLGASAEESLFAAYFTNGQNLNDHNTLIAIGKEIGLSEEEVTEALTNDIYKQKVEEDLKEARTLGVQGVPFFVINRRFAISGARQPADMLATIEKAYADWSGS
ncbi:MAG: DsbA family oxidoreductase [Paludibacter sp.]|nr:DsbA family oxidoreductase [Paludibacter sp.]